MLRTTDGRSWARIPFPEAVPLTSIRATDDKTATVTTEDGRQFVTEDGGRTWARVRGVAAGLPSPGARALEDLQENLGGSVQGT